MNKFEMVATIAGFFQSFQMLMLAIFLIIHDRKHFAILKGICRCKKSADYEESRERNQQGQDNQAVIHLE